MNKSIKVISLQGLGNSIINLPLILGLKSQFDVTTFTFANGSSQLYDEILPKTNVTAASVSKIFSAASITRTDYCISLYPNFEREAAGLFLSNSKIKLMPKLKTCFLHNLMPYKSYPIDISLHDLENNTKLIQSFYSYFAPDFQAFLKLFKQSNQSKLSQDSKHLIIHPTASTELKYYPIEFWTRLIKELSEFKLITIVCANNKRESAYCSALLNSLQQLQGRKFILLEGSSFKKLAAEINNSDLVIGLDSAICHFSALLNKETVCLWSNADIKRIYPYGNKIKVYIPQENTSLKNFKNGFSFDSQVTGRANALDLVDIINGDTPPDAVINPKFANQVNLYYF